MCVTAAGSDTSQDGENFISPQAAGVLSEAAIALSLLASAKQKTTAADPNTCSGQI